jgi:hypothetical protein
MAEKDRHSNRGRRFGHVQPDDQAPRSGTIPFPHNQEIQKEICAAFFSIFHGCCLVDVGWSRADILSARPPALHAKDAKQRTFCNCASRLFMAVAYDNAVAGR